jgi:transcriptional regulator with XRE-family HTH domain
LSTTGVTWGFVVQYVRKIRAVRERKALSQQDLADMAGVSKNTIHRLERGISRAQPRTLRKLSRALGLEPAELIDESAGDHL